MLYLLLKWLHVLAAVVAVGANLTYGIWMGFASRNPDALRFTLRGIKLIDDRAANPAYVLLLVTGLLMTFVGGLPLTAPWVMTALVLFALAAVLGLLVYSPILKRQIELLDSEGFRSPRYQALARRGTALGVALAALAIAILFLMVVKPRLWA